ncbi:hypothetical protein CU005_2118 [Enterococcus faecium]|nr:hypothetical protein [Enterococcus faecium]
MKKQRTLIFTPIVFRNQLKQYLAFQSAELQRYPATMKILQATIL